jgi:hypothetical protein
MYPIDGDDFVMKETTAPHEVTVLTCLGAERLVYDPRHSGVILRSKGADVSEAGIAIETFIPTYGSQIPGPHPVLVSFSSVVGEVEHIKEGRSNYSQVDDNRFVVPRDEGTLSYNSHPGGVPWAQADGRTTPVGRVPRIFDAPLVDVAKQFNVDLSNTNSRGHVQIDSVRCVEIGENFPGGLKSRSSYDYERQPRAVTVEVLQR